MVDKVYSSTPKHYQPCHVHRRVCHLSLRSCQQQLSIGWPLRECCIAPTQTSHPTGIVFRRYFAWPISQLSPIPLRTASANSGQSTLTAKRHSHTHLSN